MKSLRVAAAVLNQTPLAWGTNLSNILQAIELARSDGVNLLCLPELCITGYGCEDMFLAPGVWKTAWKKLEAVLPATKGLAISLGLPVYHGNGVYNTACLVVDGRIIGFAAKRHLAGDGLHYEPRWFRAWPAGIVAEHRSGERSYPIGDVVFDLAGIRIGFEICEDAWVATRPGGSLAARGVDVILNPSASHFAFGKHEVRKRFVLEGSRAFGVTYVYSNLIGNEAGRAIYDGGTLIASAAELVATGPRFTYDDVVVTAADVNIDINRTARAKTFAMRSDLSEESESTTAVVEFDWPRQPDRRPARSLWPIDPIATSNSDSSSKSDFADESDGSTTNTDVRIPPSHDISSQEEEFTRAISLALFDYLRKSRSQGFIVSMSGGADSSAVACLIRTMVVLSIKSLGIHGIRRKLGHIAAIAQAEDADAIMKALFAGVYQATANSSMTTREAAQQVTESVGGTFYLLDVDPIVAQYQATVEGALDRKLEWATDDIALQNIQARARGPSVWMLANLKNALLLSTSNRSEAAVGYATMDGDTCGGLSPIAGIDKAFLRHWLIWMETTGPADALPIPELRCVNVQQPTAELRPASFDQTDESDLMPYPLLDAIEGAAIRDKMMPSDVLNEMRLQFPGYPVEQLSAWIVKFFRLWSRNQWKRERYAPSFHVDDANLDPKTWCRFPILSGGYEEELSKLDEHGEN